MRSVFGTLVLLALAGTARGEDNPACAKYQNAFAYNACLAKLGPRAGVTHATSAPTTYAPSGARGVASLRRTKHGRVEAVFNVSGK